MTRRSWILVIAVALIATGIGAATFLVIRHRTDDRLAGWEEIKSLARGGQWALVQPRLERWIAAHPEHGESRILLAANELRHDRRDAAVELLLSVRPEVPELGTRRDGAGKPRGLRKEGR